MDIESKVFDLAEDYYKSKKIKLPRNTSLHHNVPLSLGGLDTQENIIRLFQIDHNAIHKYLNIPHSDIRALKMASNGKIIKNQKILQKEQDNVHKYFSNLALLPYHLILATFIKTCEIYLYHYNQGYWKISKRIRGLQKRDDRLQPDVKEVQFNEYEYDDIDNGSEIVDKHNALLEDLFKLQQAILHNKMELVRTQAQAEILDVFDIDKHLKQ